MHRLKCVDLVIVHSFFLPSHENCGCYGNGKSQNLHRSRDYVMLATHVPCFIKVLLLSVSVYFRVMVHVYCYMAFFRHPCL